MQITHDTQLVQEGLARLLEGYKGTTAFKELLAIYLEAFQELEDATFAVILGRMLDNAVGVQLDVLGAIVGEARQEKVDALYKVWIRVRISINKSRGTVPDIIACIQLATDAEFVFTEYSRAAFAVEFETPPDFPNDVTLVIELAKAAGVNITVIYPIDPDHTFRFKYRDSDSDDPNKGFGYLEE